MSVIPADCIARVAEALGEKASKRQLEDAAKELDRLTLEVLEEGISPADAVRLAARRYAERAELAAVIAKRNANISALRLAERLAYINSVWAGREAEGLRAVLTGSIEARRGARASVAREQTVIEGQYFGALTTDIERAGLMDTWKTGTLDREIAQGLWQLSKTTPNLEGLPKDAVTIARAIHKAQEVARADANRAGAWIGKQEGYITRQSHDPWKLEKLGRDAWVQSIAARLDWARMQAQHGPIANKAEWLAKTWNNLVSGTHLKAQGAETNSGFRGPSNLANKMSAERVLHFKSANDWFEYNQQFGTGNMRESVMRGLRSSAQNIGLMRVLGPNPENTYNRLVDALTKKLDAGDDVKALKEFRTATAEDGWLSRRLAEVTGKANIAVSNTWARRGANIRAYQSMAKLGGAVISSMNDLATYASEMSYQGRGFLSGIGEAVGSLAKGRPEGTQREILSSLGVFFDSVTGEITRTGSLDESFGGMTSRMMQTYFKWNGLNWWTETLRGSAALSMSHNLALNAGRTFGELAPDLQRTFSLFDITAKDWDSMRAKGVRTDEGGTQFITPDALSDAEAGKLRRYIVDRAETAVLEPDADVRAMLRRGSKPGTWDGEMNRFIAQFKGFSVAFTRQILGREIYGRGPAAFADGSIRGLSKLIVTSTVLGYAAMTTKDLLKGRSPRDITEKETYLRAFVQGGGAGIYGDFLFGEYSRIGQTPLETLAGPTLGEGANVVRLWSRLVRGEADAGDAFRLAQNNTPFINLFYTRIALDYLILWDMQEMIAPGTLKRMERRAKQDYGQTFFVTPSTDRARPLTD